MVGAMSDTPRPSSAAQPTAEAPETLERRRRRLEQLRRRFVALSLRSRSLRLTRPSRTGALDLSRLQAADPAGLRRLLAVLGREGTAPLALCDVVPDEGAAPFVADLRALVRAARAAGMETGAQELAVGWPLLEGRCRDGTWLRGPLLLYPVQVEASRSGRLQWMLTPQGPPDLNEALVKVLQRSAGAALTLELLLGADDDGLFCWDGPTWAGLLRALGSAGLPLDNPADQPLPALQPLGVRGWQDRERAPVDRFELCQQLVLGRFPRAQGAVASDYERLLEQEPRLERLGVAAELLLVDETAQWSGAAARGEGEGTSPALRPEQVLQGQRRWQVFPSDGSQDRAFVGASSEGSQGLVVQGPPGTGKSQMIANLVAASVSEGQRVLLLCQKRAALDVVAARLASIGLSEPVALVHDVQRDRNGLCEALVGDLARLGELAGGAEAQRERALLAGGREHALALGRVEARLTAAQQAWRLLAGAELQRPGLAALQERALDDDGWPLPELDRWVGSLGERELLERLPQLEALSLQTRALAEPHPLAERGNWAGLDAAGLDDLYRRLSSLDATLQALAAVRGGVLTPGQAQQQEAVWSRCATLLDLCASGDEQAVGEFLLAWVWTGGQAEHGPWHQTMARLQRARGELQPAASELILESVDTLQAWLAELAELGRLQGLWYRFVLPRWWRLRGVPGRVVARCQRWLSEQAGLPVDAAALCRAALPWQKLISELPADNPLFAFGFAGQPAEIDDAIEGLQEQHRRIAAVHALQAHHERHAPAAPPLPDLGAAAAPPLARQPFLAAALADRRRARLLTTLQTELAGVEGLLGEALHADLLAEGAAGRLGAARQRLVALLAERDRAADAARLDVLLAEQPAWVQRFLRGWRPSPERLSPPGQDALLAVERAWRRLDQGGADLRVLEAPLADAGQLEQLSGDLQRCHEVAGRGTLSRYRQRIAAALQEPAAGRDLRRLGQDAAKQRYRPTLRQLIERYWERGLALLRPVWFCSPDAVAALFPLDPTLFDLVILDEASQCPVESGIPALVRGRRAIIAGDDQQMPPSHFFVAALDPAELEDEDEGDAAVLASSSVLGLARIAFPGTVLRWHYRSRHEELVAFSNAAFYGRRLITAPRAEQRLIPGLEGLHFQVVDGLWQEQRNRREAEEVVRRVGTLLSLRTPEGRPPSLGIVTFNRRQAELVEELLEQRAAADEPFRQLLAADAGRPAVEQLFVRNLENVQGDERDVILLSVGYGPSEPGGRVHARFGPLGQEGGEKRLNVAITRARLGSWVFCSFDPDELRVSTSRHVGPRLLQAWLRFVRAHAAGDQGAVHEAIERAAALGGGHGVVAGAEAGLAPRPVGRRVRDELSAALRERGLRCAVALGLGSQGIDLAVGRPGGAGWQLGVDCSEFVAEADPLARDVYTPRFWQRLGWQVRRVTPGMWLHRREAVVAELEALVHATGA